MYVVIGASGQVGQEFARNFSSRCVLLTHEQIDVTDSASIDASLRGISCSGIINLAAFHNVNACEGDPDQAFRVNAIGAANVAKAAREKGCVVAYFSTDYVFGQNADRTSPYLESEPIGPLNIYGTSKAAGEHLVRAAGPNHLIVRTSSVFGAVSSRKGSTFPEMILRRAWANEPLRVVNDQYMSPTYAPDLVRCVIKLLDDSLTGTIHLVNSGVCSWHEFASATLRIAGIPRQPEAVSSEAFPSPARRPAYSALASERLSECNISPLRDWRKALEAYLVEMGVVTTELTT